MPNRARLWCVTTLLNAIAFYIQKTSEGEGQFFFPGQQYAIIKDFGNEPGNDDVIRLPGSNEDYIAKGIDLDGDGSNESTAVLYTENPNIELGVDFLPIPIVSGSSSRTIDVSAEDVLVVIVENSLVRSLSNENFYRFS